MIATARDAAALERLQALGAQAITLDLDDVSSVSGLAWQLDGEKIDVALYVADMRSTVASLRPEHNGTFINHDGQALAW